MFFFFFSNNLRFPFRLLSAVLLLLPSTFGGRMTKVNEIKMTTAERLSNFILYDLEKTNKKCFEFYFVCLFHSDYRNARLAVSQFLCHKKYKKNIDYSCVKKDY